MQTGRVIHVVSAHAEGEVGDVIVGGVAPPPGATLWEQSRWIARDGALRDLLLNEPRGGVFRHVNLLAPPMDRRADAGFIIMEPTDTPPTTPTGTGCSARMAVLSARGQLSVGDRFTGISLIGSQFHCTLAAETTVADRPAIIPSLSGRAWITGIHQHMLDPADPWPRGYRLSDSWPGTE